jgi:hypothetical protein
MPCLQVDLLDRSRMGEAHRRTRHGFGNSLSIDRVVLLRLDVRLDELRCDNAHLMAHGGELACQPLRARTGFHADDRAVGTLKEAEQRIASELNALDDGPRAVETDDVEDVLAEVDAINGGVLRNSTRH